MTIPVKYQYTAAAVLIVTAFAFGRYSVNAPTVKTTENITTTDKTTEAKNTHTKTTITEVKRPSGVDTKTTVIDQVANDNTARQDQENLQVQQTVTPPKKDTLNISLLGANDFSRGLLVPTYGLSVTKSVLGPITIGAFGLMNGVVGVSIGLNF